MLSKFDKVMVLDNVKVRYRFFEGDSSKPFIFIINGSCPYSNQSITSNFSKVNDFDSDSWSYFNERLVEEDIGFVNFSCKTSGKDRKIKSSLGFMDSIEIIDYFKEKINDRPYMILSNGLGSMLSIYKRGFVNDSIGVIMESPILNPDILMKDITMEFDPKSFKPKNYEYKYSDWQLEEVFNIKNFPLDKIEVPVIITHGVMDSIFSTECLFKSLSKILNRDSNLTFKLFPNFGHQYPTKQQQRIREYYIKIILSISNNDLDLSKISL